MAESLTWDYIGSDDLKLGHGTFGPVTLPDGSTPLLNKIGIHTLLKPAYLSATDFTGADAGAQINAAVAGLPSTGGTVDASGLYGTQNWTTTVTVDRPVMLRLNVNTLFTGTASPWINVTSAGGLTIQACGKGLTICTLTNLNASFITATTQNPIVVRNMYLTSSGQLSGAYISLTGPGGSTANNHSIIEYNHFTNGYIGLDLGITDALRTLNNQFDGTQYRGIRINNTANADQGDNFICGNAFASDTSKSDTAAVELQAGGVADLIGNKFFQHKYGFLMNWGSNSGTGQLLIQSNRFEAMTTAGIRFQRQGGFTGGILGIQVEGNWLRADSAGTNNGNLIDFQAMTGIATATGVNIIGNYMYAGDTATAINIATGNGDINIDDNFIQGNAGTSKGIVAAAGVTELHIGLGNQLTGLGGGAFAIGTAISAVARVANLVTVTIASTTGYSNGQSVLIDRVADTSFNGTFVITVTSGTQFTYAQTAGNATSSGGTSTYTPLRGGYTPDTIAIGVYPDAGPCANPISIACNSFIASRNAGNTAFKRMIGVDSTNVVSIDPDTLGTYFGANTSAYQIISRSPTNQLIFTDTFQTNLNRPAPAAARNITLNDALADSQVVQEIHATDSVALALVATGAMTVPRTVAVTGARFGDGVVVTAAAPLETGTFLVGSVISTNNVSWQFGNLSGGNVTHNSGVDVFTIHVYKH